jgi:hypothetical protein
MVSCVSHNCLVRGHMSSVSISWYLAIRVIASRYVSHILLFRKEFRIQIDFGLQWPVRPCGTTSDLFGVDKTDVKFQWRSLKNNHGWASLQENLKKMLSNIPLL